LRLRLPGGYLQPLGDMQIAAQILGLVGKGRAQGYQDYTMRRHIFEGQPCLSKGVPEHGCLSRLPEAADKAR